MVGVGPDLVSSQRDNCTRVPIPDNTRITAFGKGHTIGSSALVPVTTHLEGEWKYFLRAKSCSYYACISVFVVTEAGIIPRVDVQMAIEEGMGGADRLRRACMLDAGIEFLTAGLPAAAATHTLYDFVALVYIVREWGGSKQA